MDRKLNLQIKNLKTDLRWCEDRLPIFPDIHLNCEYDNGLTSNVKLNTGYGIDLLIGGNSNIELTSGKGVDSFQCGVGSDTTTCG